MVLWKQEGQLVGANAETAKSKKCATLALAIRGHGEAARSATELVLGPEMAWVGAGQTDSVAKNGHYAGSFLRAVEQVFQ